MPAGYMIGRIVKRLNEPNPLKSVHQCEGRTFKEMNLDELLNKGPQRASNNLTVDFHTLKAPIQEARA